MPDGHYMGSGWPKHFFIYFPQLLRVKSPDLPKCCFLVSEEIMLLFGANRNKNDHPGLLLSETVYISSPELLCQVIRIARNVPLGKCCYFSGHVNIGMIFHKLWTFIVEYFMYKFESGVFDIVHSLQYSNIC